MLEEVKWGEFRIGDLFEVTTSKGYDAGKLSFVNQSIETFEFVGRTKSNYGIQGFVERLDTEPNNKDTISVSQIGAVHAQLRKRKWYSSQNVFVLTPKTNQLINLLTVASINKILSNYGGYSSYPTLKTLREHRIELPILEDGEINFSFMEKFIAELEATHLAELDAYLSVTGLKDYELTKEERQALEDFENKEWGEFNLVEDIFNVKNAGNILSREIEEDSGQTPYLSASANNNAVSSYITYNTDYLDEGNCIFIGGKTFVVTYQEKDFYSNDSHNLILYLKEEKYRDKLNQLYLVTCVIKSLQHKYTWGDSISSRKIKKDKILLPVVNKKPNYASMATFIKAIEKLVIKDVVKFSNKKIETTKEIINK